MGRKQGADEKHSEKDLECLVELGGNTGIHSHGTGQLWVKELVG